MFIRPKVFRGEPDRTREAGPVRRPSLLPSNAFASSTAPTSGTGKPGLAQAWKATTVPATQAQAPAQARPTPADTLIEETENLRTARAALAAAASASHTALTSEVVLGTPAATAGGLTIVAADAGAPSSLSATHAINERTTTVRASTQALGLDVTTTQAASTVVSGAELNTVVSTVRTSASALDLDLTGTESASTIQATRDVVEQVSTVRSSASALALDTTTAEAASTLASTSEANTAATSYEKVFLSFATGTSTATLSGVYTGTGGAAGATQLRFDMGNNVTLGASATTLKFKVRDQNNDVLLDYSASVRAGDVISLGASIGLSIKFSAGTLKSTDLATSNVSKTTPTNIDANATFNNADLNLRPRFEGGAQVVAGSFQVNGVSVAVNAGDTVNTVLARISSSGAGVTASFAGDRVTLQTAAASEQNITLSGDTSGFLAALKLTGATSTKGNVHDDVQALGQVAAFAGVAAGSFQLNGVSISVAPSTDTLQGLLGRINASGAGVTASYGGAAREVTFTPNTAGATLNVANDTSGVLAALGISTGIQGSKVNAAAAFNGTGTGSPLFDAGVSVGTGSFTVNGVSIAVAANDSVDSVLARITASAAGVTASYDTAADRVNLVAKTPGKTTIALGSDTSGFLAAMKLTTATGAGSTPGYAQTPHERLALTTPFSAMSSDSFQVNGVSISVNPTNDSLDTLLARINASGAGVTATLDQTTRKIALTPSTAGATLDLRNDTSGFLQAAGLALGVQGSHVNRAAAFNGQGLASPLFEAGVSVGAGSFTVNGASITVSASDSIDSVLSRLNASGAGVVATFDDATEKVTLVTTSLTRRTITLGPDTSGFLAATKLAAAQGGVSTAGFIRGDQELFSESARFGAVISGSFRVNGQTIAVGPSDNLAGVVARINASGAGVTASFDASTNRLVLTPNVAGATLTVDSDTSGFLAATAITPGTEATRVNADAAFSGAGINSPFFDQGQAVGNGSFRINGHQIAIGANDTLNGVIARINAAGIGVQAALDTNTQRLSLVTTTSSDQTVSVGNDTSGFLAATKLDGTASSVLGRAAIAPQNLDTRLSQSRDLASVQAGIVTLNGQQIAVDPTTQTLRGLLATFNGLNGVRVRADENTGRLSITSSANGGTLEVADSSGLLAALGVARGIFRGTPDRVTEVAHPVAVDPASQVADVQQAITRLNQALERAQRVDSAGPELRERLGRAMAAYQSTQSEAARNMGLYGSRSGDLVLDAAELTRQIATPETAPAVLAPLAALTDAVAGAVAEAQRADRAKAAADEIRKPQPRERIQLAPEVAGTVGTLALAQRMELLSVPPSPRAPQPTRPTSDDKAEGARAISATGFKRIQAAFSAGRTFGRGNREP